MDKTELLETMADALGLDDVDMAFIGKKEAELAAKAVELREVFNDANIALATKVGNDTFVNVVWLNQIVQEVALASLTSGRKVEAIQIAEMLSFTVTAALAEVDTNA